MSRTLWSTPPLSFWSTPPHSKFSHSSSLILQLRRPPVQSETGTEYGARSVVECEREAVARSSGIGPRGGYLPRWQWDMADVWTAASQKGNDLGPYSAGEVSQAQTAQRATPHLVFVFAFAFATLPFSRFVIFDSETLKNIYITITETNRFSHTSLTFIYDFDKVPDTWFILK